MSVSFTLLKANGQRFDPLPGHDDREFSLSNANAADVLRRSRPRRLLLRTPLADSLLPGAPHRRPAQAPRPRLPSHPRHRNEKAGDDARDRLRSGRRLHRAKARKALRSRERGRRNRSDACGMGLTPDHPPDDGDASDVGRPPSGSRSTRGLKAAHEARRRSSPSRVTIADAGEGGRSPSLPSKPPRGIGRTVARFPQFRRAQSALYARLLSQVRSTKSAPPARRPSRCFPVRPCPPLTPSSPPGRR